MKVTFVLAAVLTLSPAAAQPQNNIDSAGSASEHVLSARQLQQAGQYNAARAVLLKALSDAPDSASLLDAMGSVEQDMGDYLEAERFYLRALRVSQSGMNTERLVTLNNLGTLYLETAQYAKGDRVREQLEKLAPAVLEARPRAAAILLSIIGGLEQARNRAEEAESYYLRSLQLFRRANGAPTEEAAAVKNNLGGLRLEAGQYQSASDLFQQAIREIEKASGPESPALIRPLVNAAASENRAHHASLAEPLARRAVALSVKVLGEGHPVTATAMLEQAAALRRLGKKGLARNLEKHARAGLRASSPINTSGYTVSLRDLAKEK
jgi:tetratricopeptide (TPR) repeat protein